MRTLLAGIVALALLLIAAPNPAGSAIAQEACDPARPHEPGTSNATIESGGLTRNYLLHVPALYTGNEPQPLIVMLHGSGSNAQQQLGYTGFAGIADREGFILVAPNGTGEPQRWNFTAIEAGLPDDLAFISDLLDALEGELCIHPSSIFVTGISNGAAMAVRLACDLSDRVEAIATVAAIWFPPGCASERPVPVLAFHGTDDPIVPYDGSATSPAGFPVPAVEDAVASWADFDGCGDTPDDQQASQAVRLISYGGCDEDVSVALYRIEGGGHTWPDAVIDLPEDIFGATMREINANELIWAFFATGAPATLDPVQPQDDPTPEPEATDAPGDDEPSGDGDADEENGGSSAPGWFYAVVIGVFAGTAIFAGTMYLYARRAL